MSNSADNLAVYGTTFQTKVITVLLKNKPFLSQIQDILEPTYFSSDATQWIVNTILQHFTQYKAAPTLEVFKVKLDDVTSETLKVTVVETLKDATKYLDAEDLVFVEDQVLDFCKNQKLKAAILECVNLLGSRKYDEMKTTIDTALKAGSDKNVGHNYETDLEERFKENIRNCIPTPWDVLTDLLDGGLGAGEMGVFVAPAGIGKSMALVNIAADAVKRGKTVIYYTLELSDTYVGARFDSFYSGIPTQDLKFHKEAVQHAVNALKGRLIIKYYPTKTATVNTISAHLEKCALQGLKPDLICVDYADLLRDTTKGNNIRNDIMLSNIYEDLRGLAGTHQIPLYTASQSNRSSTEDDVIEAGKIAEAYSKVMIADFVMSLSRKMADKISGTGRFHVIKNRFGPDGLTFPSKMNMSISKIDIYAENTILGQEVKGMMKNDQEVVRKHLSNKFSELNSNKLFEK